MHIINCGALSLNNGKLCKKIKIRFCIFGRFLRNAYVDLHIVLIMRSIVIKRRFWIISLLFVLLVVVSGSYSISKFDVFAQAPSSSDLGNGPIPEDNSTDIINGPIPEDNSTGVNNGPGTLPEDNSTGVNNSPTLPEENQTTGIPDMNPMSDNSTTVPETTPTPAKTTMFDPLMQFKSGVAAKDVQCRLDFQLVLRAEDGSPACIEKNNVDDLVKRGWAKPIQS